MPEQPSPRFITAAEVATVDLPPGGSTGQVLAKASNADRDCDWASVSGTGDVVGPDSATDGHLAVFDGVTGKLIKDGGAPGGGGSFLSANTARVDPSGNDGTGEVGDLSKPFLTVQGALGALLLNELPLNSAWGGVIQLPAINLTEHLTLNVGTKFVMLTFKGYRGNNLPGFTVFNSLTITDTASPSSVELVFENCDFGEGDVDGVVIKSTLPTGVFLSHCALNGKSIVTTNTTGGLTVGSYDNSAGGFYEIRSTTGPQITVFGVWSDGGGTITGKEPSGGTVSVINCRGNPSAPTYDDIFEVSCVDGTVTVVDSILDYVDAGTGDVFATNTRFNDVDCATGTWVDSRTASLSSGDISYEDIMLKGVPPGGTTGQFLKKASDDNFDDEWGDVVP